MAVLAAGSVRRPGLSRTLVPARVPAGSTARVDLELRRHGVGLGTWSTLSDTTPPELIGAPVALLSTSPERDDTILMRDPFQG